MNLEKEIFDISLKDIMPNRFQPREIFEDSALQELADSIKQHGVIQPIIVRKVGDKYEIIAGERRFRASQLAGKETIPALVRDIDDKEAAKIALLENLQRKDLTPIEEAKTYQTILKLDNITQDELAQNLGKSQSAVANKLRLLNLDEEVQTALLNSQISERHARSLLPLDHEKQRELLHKIINERLTVRQVDEEVMRLTGNSQELVSNEEENQTIMPHDKENNFNNYNIPNASNFNNRTISNSNVNTELNKDIQNANSSILNNQIPLPEVSNQVTQNNEVVNSEIINNNEAYKFNSQIDSKLDSKKSQGVMQNITQPSPVVNIPTMNSNAANINQDNISKMQDNYSDNNTNKSVIIPSISEQEDKQRKEENIFDKLRVNSEQENKSDQNISNNIAQNNKIINNQNILSENYNNIYDLRFAINNFRQAVQNTEKFGFKVKTEEKDNQDSYQIIITIDKKS